ncbi:di-trans,poly-cis-decaprenylcistransferase [candidate division WWE3 bacterium CG22_combo_CG10-13_8_21_14_all_39_12]|uniref:Isoprenyl transferase n=2 Tax=Katanobacteria TaxID=422282 RepID=A0A2M7X316_UNCKA|nr:MAG: di-trans,poly-cis-decaprenylcistransferase [candidate division WWE3 bacterium CG22_combo_CG10-13_8_21_14_all_39_12]PJA40582.1 MAG: di-trans,poly-cis-decaprenylcistransferase [candidate division WWE3 bacterium CG_4_9_14_3_um_filter_39_7]
MDIKSNYPQHIAIIMDGNRRWATKHDLSYIDGHKKALFQVQEVIEECVKLKIPYLTLWAWSTKNWKRNPDFIKDIISLFRESLKPDGFFADAIRKGVEIQHIGSLEAFPKDIKDRVADFLSQSPPKNLIHVNFAVGYDGQDELVRAYKKIIADNVSPDKVTPELVEKYLDTKGQPPVDLVIRTGGDKRTSGFLIWQAAQAELYFTDTYMPDFGESDLKIACSEYSQRERRLGGDSLKY